MIKRIYALMLVSLLATNCTKSELDDSTIQGDNLSNQITFGLGANWTRGANIAESGDIPSLTVYSYYANYATISATSWDDVTAEGLKPLFTNDINTPFALTNDGYDQSTATTWSYTGGPQYWPNGEDEKLSFIAIYPDGGLTHTPNQTTGLPEFYYTQLGLAGENDDIVYAAHFDKRSSDDDIVDGVVDFNLQHLLAKLTLNAKLTGTCTEDENYTNVKYAINGITIYGLYSDAQLVINSDGTTTWNIDKSKTLDITATQDVTFLAVDDAAAELNGDTYTDVMAKATEANTELGTEATKEQAIFVIPQEISTARGDDDAPSVIVRIRKSFDSLDEDGETFTTQVIYETSEIEIPAADADLDWKASTHYALSFVFDIGNLDKYATPLTLTSAIYGWTETTVDVDVNPNTYMYASANYFEVGADEEYADMIICTNYEYDLRRHCRKYELDGTPTEAAGFTFYLVNNNDAYNGTWTEIEDGRLEPVLLWDDSGDFGSKEHVYSDLTEYVFGYDTDGTLYLTSDGGETKETVTLDADGYADPTPFEDIDGWMYFAIKPDPNNSDCDFYYKVKKTTRAEEGMYTNSSVDGDTSYGINKSEGDAVYTLRLNINEDHLYKTADDSNYGYFFGKIGAEALSNGGGLVTTKFKVTLKKELNN